MFKIDKEDKDRLLEQFLVEITEKNGSKRCAEECYKILEDPMDSDYVVTTLLTNSLYKNNSIPQHVLKFESEILSGLTSIFSTIDKKYIPIQFVDLFEGTQQEIIEKTRNDKKFNIAIQRFVSSYFIHDFFESKYPEISKIL
jgi:hypothetical protein